MRRSKILPVAVAGVALVMLLGAAGCAASHAGHEFVPSRELAGAIPAELAREKLASRIVSCGTRELSGSFEEAFGSGILGAPFFPASVEVTAEGLVVTDDGGKETITGYDRLTFAAAFTADNASRIEFYSVGIDCGRPKLLILNVGNDSSWSSDDYEAAASDRTEVIMEALASLGAKLVTKDELEDRVGR